MYACIDLFDGTSHACDVVACGGGGMEIRSKPGPEICRVAECLERLREVINGTGFHQKAGYTVLDNFRDPADPGGNDGSAE